jgi:hypothetical protein
MFSVPGKGVDMQTNKSGDSIDFINRDVKDFPATENRETIHRVHFEDIAMLVIFALIVLMFLGLFFSGYPETDGLEERELINERQPAYVALQTGNPAD